MQCSFVFSGRVAEDCVVESLDVCSNMNLPALIECNNIPDVREEIPTTEIARHYNHLMDIQEFIPLLSEKQKKNKLRNHKKLLWTDYS